MPYTREDLIVSSLGPCRVDSPMTGRFSHDDSMLNYVDDTEHVYVEHTDPESQALEGVPRPGFEFAGPRRKIFFDPSKCRAAIVTCGGLCPGLNDVIRGLTIELAQRYGVTHVYGFRNGYAGFIPEYDLPVMDLDPEVVSEIYEKGGTILGSSRGDPGPRRYRRLPRTHEHQHALCYWRRRDDSRGDQDCRGDQPARAQDRRRGRAQDHR